MTSDPTFSGPPDADSPRWSSTSNGSPAPSSGVTAFDIVGVLRRNAWIILGCGALAFGGARHFLSKEVKSYQAEALVRVGDVSAEIAQGVLSVDGQYRGTTSNLEPLVSASVLELAGRGLAGDVVDREGLRLVDLNTSLPSPLVSAAKVTLPADAGGRVSLVFETDTVSATVGADSVRGPYGAPLILNGIAFTVEARPTIQRADLAVVTRDQAVDGIIGSVEARDRQGTDLVTVIFRSTNPRLAVRMVNAVVEEHRARSAAAARRLAQARREFIDKELAVADSSALAARVALQRFRSQEKVYRSEERAVAEQRAIKSQEAARDEIIDELRVYRSLLAEVERPDSPDAVRAFRTMTTVPVIAENPVATRLSERLTRFESLRDSLVFVGRPATHESVRQLDRLIGDTKGRIVDALGIHVNVLDDRLRLLNERLLETAAQLLRLAPSEAEEVRLLHNVETTLKRADHIRQQGELARIYEAAALGKVQIVDRATRALPAGGTNRRKIVLALVFGLVLGGGIALLREHLNTSVHRRSEVEALLQIPGLAVIPRLPTATRGFFRWRTKRGASDPIPGHPGLKEAGKATSSIMLSVEGLVTVTHSRDRGAEAYRALRTKILFLRDKLPLKTLVVTSPTIGEGKTTTAANLATALAQQGVRVLLIDCDLRRPRLHKLFGTTRAPGLTDVLKSTVQAHDAIRQTAVEGLHLLPRGTRTLQPAELLGGGWMVAALRQLGKQYDMVILDTPPVLSASDAASLSARADGVLLVLRAGQTERAVAQEAMHQLSAVGANVIGAVLNDPDAQIEKYESYGYAYAYPYES